MNAIADLLAESKLPLRPPPPDPVREALRRDLTEEDEVRIIAVLEFLYEEALQTGEEERVRVSWQATIPVVTAIGSCWCLVVSPLAVRVERGLAPNYAISWSVDCPNSVLSRAPHMRLTTSENEPRVTARFHSSEVERTVGPRMLAIASRPREQRRFRL